MANASEAHAGLPKLARQSLGGRRPMPIPPMQAGVATPKFSAPRLRPGAQLVREWQGGTNTVAVLDDVFEFEGRRYGSLTQIAREITGAHWSGRRFFELAKGGRRPANPAPMPHVDPVRAMRRQP